MRFIGDVHGKYKPYKRLIKDIPASIQVGDMGVGFRRITDSSWYPNPPHYAMTNGNHRFIRGNHDNPTECYKHSQFIPDGQIEGNMMFIGGAKSTDAHLRYENFDYWKTEELRYDQLNVLTEKYEVNKPEIMVTHDCPEEVAVALNHRQYRLEVPSITRQALQVMFEIHKPKLWIYGHWHISSKMVINGCEFICLNELEAMDIEI